MADIELKPGKIYYTMGEVAEMFDVNQSLIRFWEQRFKILKPKKNKKGNRLFTPEDIKNLELIYHLVKERGMTLAGAEKALREKGDDVERDTKIVRKLHEIKAVLLEVREELGGYHGYSATVIPIDSHSPEIPDDYDEPADIKDIVNGEYIIRENIVGENVVIENIVEEEVIAGESIPVDETEENISSGGQHGESEEELQEEEKQIEESLPEEGFSWDDEEEGCGVSTWLDQPENEEIVPAENEESPEDEREEFSEPLPFIAQPLFEVEAASEPNTRLVEETEKEPEIIEQEEEKPGKEGNNVIQQSLF